MRERVGGDGPVRQEWRCIRCGKLLGVVEDGRLHIRFARGHEYIVGFPASCVCRSCKALNELSTAHPEKEQVGVDRR